MMPSVYQLLKIALRNMKRNMSRTVLIIVAAMVGTTLMSTSFLLQGYITKSVEDLIDQEYGPIISDIPASGQSNLVETSITQRQASQVENILSSHQHSYQATNLGLVPIVGTMTNIFRERDIPPSFLYSDVYVYGLEVEAITDFYDQHLLLMLTSLKSDEIVIHQDLAEKLQVQVGESVTLFDASKSRHPFKVKSIIDEQGLLGYRGLDLVRASALISLESARRIASIEANQYSNLLVVDWDIYESQLRNKGQRPFEVYLDGWKIIQIRQLAANMFEDFSSIINVFMITSVISICISIILITNIFTIITEERQMEFGILRAMGITRTQLIFLLLIEGAFYALFAAILGGSLGILLSNLLMLNINNIFNEMISYWEIYFPYFIFIDLFALGKGVLIGCLMVCVSMWLVARNAGRRPIHEALKASNLYSHKLFSSRHSLFSSLNILIVVGVGMISIFLITLFVPFQSNIQHFDLILLFIFISGMLLLFLAVMLISFGLQYIKPLVLMLVKKYAKLKAVINIAFGYAQFNHKRNLLIIMMFAIVLFISSISSMFSKNMSLYLFELDGTPDGYVLTAYTFHEDNIEVRDGPIFTKDKLHLQDTIDVKEVTGYVETFLFENKAVLKGIDQSFLDNYLISLISRDARFDSDQEVWNEVNRNPNVIILSHHQQFIEQEKYSIGDMYTIRIGQKVIEKKIIGIEGISPYLPEFSIWMNKEELIRLVPDQREVRKVAIIQLHKEANLIETIDDVEQKVALQNLQQFKNVTSMIVNSNKTNRKVYSLFETFNALAIFIGIVGLMVVIIRMIQERYRHIGVLRVIGIQPKIFILSMVIEGTLIGLVGMTLGVIVGCYTGYLMLQSIFMGTSNLKIEGLIFLFPYFTLGIHYLGGLLMILLCTSLASYKSIHISPVEGTRHSK